jgi:hypothetical protein
MAAVDLYLNKVEDVRQNILDRLGKALYNAFMLAVLFFAISYLIVLVTEGELLLPGPGDLIFPAVVGLAVGLFNQFGDYLQRYRLVDVEDRLTLEARGRWLQQALNTARFELVSEDDRLSLFRPRMKLRRIVNIDNKVEVYQTDETFELVAPRSVHFRINKTLELLQQAQNS